MKTAIIFYSKHHGNTKKLIEAATEGASPVLIDITEQPSPELEGYDRIGIASGIYYSRFNKKLISLVEERLPEGQEVFLLYTYGARKNGYTDAIRRAVEKRGARVLGEYGSYGFNTFGPFKLIGGIAKGHPDADELKQAKEFFESLLKE